MKPIKSQDEVEAYYARFLEWLWADDQACSELIYNAWTYDLLKHGTFTCKDAFAGDENALCKALRSELMLPSEANRTLIEKFKCSNNIGPFVSGDILFMATGNTIGNDNGGSLEADSDNGLFAINLETGEFTQVLDGRIGVEAMAVDATNNRIIFAREENIDSDNEDEAISQIWVLDLDKKQPRRLGYMTYQGTPAEIEGLTFMGDKLLAFPEDFAFRDDIGRRTSGK